MAEPWFVKVADGTVEGPYLERDISTELLSGKIGDQHQVRQGENGPWYPASRARLMFQQLAEQGWYIRSNDEVFGPFTDAKLLQLHRDGDVDSNAEIRQGTTAKWKPAEAVLRLFQNQKVAQAPADAKKNDLRGYDSSESIGGGKWSIEPMRHALVDLEVHYDKTARTCAPLEHLLLQQTDDEQMGERLLLTRTNGQRVGFLGLENSRQILSNSERGLSHITLLYSAPDTTPITVAIVLCPPGSTSDACKSYIEEHFHQQFLRAH